MDKVFSRIAEHIALWAGRPLAFILASTAVIVWAVTGPSFGYSETWQLVINTGTTIITFLMVFLIQNSQNRDTIAMHSKLDEIIRAMSGASNAYIGLERMTDTEIEEFLERLQQSRRRNKRAAAQAAAAEKRQTDAAAGAKGDAAKAPARRTAAKGKAGPRTKGGGALTPSTKATRKS